MPSNTYYPIKPDVEGAEVLAEYRGIIEEKETQLLSPHAALSKKHSRKEGIENDHRLPYKRDVDRIVHSKAFARYVDKTQVVYLVDNDHITHRSLHVQLVSNFARGIAEILGLNMDLVEAIALGHDVGHPPFGHEGEHYLTQLSREYGLGSFSHPWQSCRLFREIEPLNLGLAVYDGFLCHDGGMKGTVIEPHWDKTWEDHLSDLATKQETPGKNIMPMTLEGCLVKLCDTMSYLGKDIEDAVRLGIIQRSQVPETCLGNENRHILSRVASSIIEHSYGKPHIALAEEVFAALKQIRQFNFKEIYTHRRLKVESEKIRRSFQIMFETLLGDLDAAKEESFIFRNYLHDRPEAYLKDTAPARMVMDYIAGMTDGYFVKTFETLFVPQRIRLS